MGDSGEAVLMYVKPAHCSSSPLSFGSVSPGVAEANQTLVGGIACFAGSIGVAAPTTSWRTEICQV